MRSTCALLLLALLSRGAAAQPTWRNVSLPTGVTLSVMLAGQPLGAPGAEVLLFLHGFPEGSFSWWPCWATGLLDAYTLVAPDQRGYNASFSPASAGDASLLVPQLAADALALIEALGGSGGSAHVVAHDWGGGVAWWMAALQLPAVKSLTILNMPHPQGWLEAVRTLPAQQQASAYVLSFIEPGFGDLLTANNCSALKSLFAKDAWFPGAAEAALAASWRVPGSVSAALGWYRKNIRPRCPRTCITWQCFEQGVAGEFDAMPHNGSVSSGLPVRVLWGMGDTAFDNEWQLAYLASRVPQAVVTRYPAATHWIAQEMPEEVARQVAAFVRGRAAA
jgi:pimeloyl-ACP methyl ester carboxylesterase